MADSEPNEMSQASTAQTKETPSSGHTTAAKHAERPKLQKLPPWNVILLNDDDHSYEYVIEMLGVVAAIPIERAFQMAKEVDSSGRVIVLTTHREKAELKQEEIHSYGIDQRISRCRGSMSAIIEPADSA